MAEDSKIIQRIKALMQKTVEKGCTEEEQDAAQRMIAGLVIKHGIDESKLQEDEPSRVQRSRKITEVKPYEVLVAVAAAELFGCRVIRYKNPDYLEFVGREDNVAAAEATMFWHLQQLGTFYKQALPKGLSKTDRAEFRRSFRTACALRIQQRAIAFVEELKSNNQIAQATTASTALVVQGYFERLAEENQKFLEENNPTLKKGRRSKIRLRGTEGTYAGLKAGDKVQLKHREIE